MDERDVEEFLQIGNYYLISGAKVEMFLRSYVPEEHVNIARSYFSRETVKTDLNPRQLEEITEFFDAIKDLILERLETTIKKYEERVGIAVESDDTQKLADLHAEKILREMSFFLNLGIEETERFVKNFNVRAKLVNELVELRDLKEEMEIALNEIDIAYGVWLSNEEEYMMRQAEAIEELAEEAFKYIFRWLYLREYVSKDFEDLRIEVPDLEYEIDAYVERSIVNPREIWAKQLKLLDE